MDMEELIDKLILKINLETEQNETGVVETWSRSSVLTDNSEWIACHNEDERVHFVEKFFSFNPVKTEILGKYQKNPEISRQLRERGNEFFKHKNFGGALKTYNVAILFAPNGHEALGMVYANRSAVLVELREYEGALEDIKFSLTNGYPKSLAEKLERRKKKCEDMLGLRRGDAIWKKVKKEIGERKKIRDEILQVRKPNTSIPGASSCIEINFDNVQGRHLVVSQDVSEGTVLFVEDPYAFALTDLIKWDTNHCHYCLKSIVRGIPCNNCVFASYCNEACMSHAAEGLHKWECNCLAYLHCKSAPGYLLVAFRIICKLGPDGLYELFLSKGPDFWKQQERFGVGIKYESDSYMAIHHLETHSEKLKPLKRFGNTHAALEYTSVLESQTSFFAEIPQDHQADFKNFVAALLLRHIECTGINFAAIGELKGLEQLSLADSYRMDPEMVSTRIEETDVSEFASGVYPLFSLLSHSCDPNIYRFNDIVNGKVVVMANRPLKKGETLCTSYRKNFMDNPLPDRQSYLYERYFFRCQCLACKYDWPTLNEMVHGKLKFCCPFCSKSFKQDETASEDFLKCQLNEEGGWNCGLCRKRYNQENVEMHMDMNLMEFMDAHELLMKNHPIEAIPALKTTHDYFRTHLCSPSRQFCYSQAIYMKALSLIFYYSQ